MCLPNFIRFDDVDESTPIIGYRIWRNKITRDNLTLKSEHINYDWPVKPEQHIVTDSDSGIYAYNDYNYNYNYNYNYYNYNNNYSYNNSYNYNNNYNSYYNNNYNNNYNNYKLFGIIKQYGRIAFHKDGQRSEYARIDTIFTIRELDAEGPAKFLDWIKLFNIKIQNIAYYYKIPNVISWQVFKERNG